MLATMLFDVEKSAKNQAQKMVESLDYLLTVDEFIFNTVHAGNQVISGV